MPEIAFGMYGFTRRDAQVEHQQRHGNGKDSVAQGCEALHALPGNTVVQRMHRMESSTGGRAFMSRNAGRGERRVPSATLRRAIRNCANCLLVAFLFLSISGWSQDQQNPPAQPTQNPPPAAPQNPPPADEQNPP